MGSDAVRIGVVGLGYWGPNLVRNLADLPQFELAALCDLGPDLLEQVGRRYPGVRRTTSADDVFADDTIDAVVVATPVSTHYDLAKAALEAGKHVFVEKPLAASSAEVRELTRTAAENDLVVMPGHTFLYSPPVRAIKTLIDAGELGEIYFISTSRVNLGLHQPDVSVVWDLGPHDFSILRYWLDELPVRVSALSRCCVFPQNPDVAFIALAYEAGPIAHAEFSWLAPSKLRRTTIVGSEKMVIYDDSSNEPVRIFDSGATLPDPGSFGEYRLSYRTGAIISPPIAATEPLAIELADFASAVLDGTPPVSSAQVGLDVVLTIEAVNRSLEAGGMPVAIEGGAATALDQELQAQLDQLASVDDAPHAGNGDRSGSPAAATPSTSAPKS